jgi:hypothetical protein
MISSRLHSRYHGENIPQYPLDGRLDGSLRRFRCGGKGKNLNLPPPRNQSAVIQPVANHCTEIFLFINVEEYISILRDRMAQSV